MSGLTREAINVWKTSPNAEETIQSLKTVNSYLGQKFAFPELNENIRKDVCDFFVAVFSDAPSSYQCALLELVRILCRDKNGINSLFSEELVELVLKAAGIFPKSRPTDHNVLMEAVKCLVNALFNSVVARTGFENKCCQLMVQRDEEIIYDMDVAESCAKECSKIVQNPTVDDDLKQNAIHLLATMPSCLPLLCPEVKNNEIETTKIYENCDMRFVDSTLELLSRKIDKTGPSEVDLLSTFFTTLIHLCKNHKPSRRYCRLKVIPPLKAQHVEKPPDEGRTLRNKIVRLLTSPTHCKDLAAEFLFVLCKRNVNRLIKYTGFGHSAGLLANYGFLGAINNPRRDSDSEDSETESYKQVENRVNPVTGYIQPEIDNPLDHMTEEQKEYEAMQLANAMDKLMESGVFQPASIGPDGKPKAVSHVNELIKNIPSEDENSDSD